MKLRRKRAYDTAEASDGFRVLVDRLWPLGISKERAEIDLWAKPQPRGGARKGPASAAVTLAISCCAAQLRSFFADPHEIDPAYTVPGSSSGVMRREIGRMGT